MRYAQVQELIAAGGVRDAIDQLLIFLKDRQADAPVNELILLSSRLINNERSLRLGLIGQEEASRVRSQVDWATLEMANEIRDILEIAVAAPAQQATMSAGITRILFAESNPFPDKQLSSAEESRELGLVFRNHPKRAQFSLKKEFALSLQLLLRVVNEDCPDLLHLSAFANDTGCYLHSEDDSPRFVANESLIAAVALMETQPRCLFFNTWISSSLAITLSLRIPWVIGSNQLISNQAAIAFATGFYQAIAYGKSVSEAFEVGKRVLVLEKLQAEQNKIFLANNGQIVSPI